MMAIQEVFMSKVRYTDEFKAEAVKQVIERGFTVVDVAGRIGVPKHTLYDWVQRARRTAKPEAAVQAGKSDSAEVRRPVETDDGEHPRRQRSDVRL